MGFNSDKGLDAFAEGTLSGVDAALVQQHIVGIRVTGIERDDLVHPKRYVGQHLNLAESMPTLQCQRA